MSEVLSGQVHGNAEQRAAGITGLPTCHLIAGRVQYLDRHRDDQACIFADRYKFIWRNKSAGRMVPSDEGLKPDQFSAFEADDRLVEQFKFLSLDSVPEVGFELHSGDRPDVHLLIEDNVVLVVVLCVVHRDIRISQEIFGLDVARISKSDTDLNVRKDLTALDRVRLRDAFIETVGKGQRFVAKQQIAQNDPEFVAAEPCDHVVLADHFTQPLANISDQAVAHRMAKAVIDGLKSVEVEQKYGKVRLGVILALLKHQFQPIDKVVSVRKSG